MTTATTQPGSSSLDAQDFLFALFRYQWLVVLCTLLGLAAALAFYFLSPRSYQSETSLLVKYVLDRNSVDPVDAQTDASGRSGDSLIAAEVAILTSWDLAAQVAEAVGPNRLLAGKPGDHSAAQAAGVILGGLDVRATRGSNVLVVDYHGPDPALVQPVLAEFVRRYFDKHLEVHRSTQAFDFVSQQRDLVRSRLSDLDFRIQTLEEQGGISLLADNATDLQTQIARARQELKEAQTAQDEQSARVNFLVKGTGGRNPGREPAKPPPDEAPGIAPVNALREYQDVAEQLTAARRTVSEQLTRFTEQTAEVQASRARINQLAARRTKLEGTYPGLAATAAKGTSDGRAIDLGTEQAQLAAARGKVAALRSQLDELQAAMKKFNVVAPQLADLQAQRQAEQKNYTDFQAKLDKSRIDEALDPSKIPNISVLQKPSPAAPVAGKTLKIAAGLAAGGLALGLTLAIGLGAFLDRTVKRPLEFEKKLRLPLLMTIPRLSPSRWGGRERTRPTGNTDGSVVLAEPAPWETNHFIRPFAMALRDRLGLYFDLHNLQHKPKLIAVTSLAHGAGSTTVAGGLAAALSEDGHRKVLLVDMNTGRARLRFFEGQPACSLSSALTAGEEITPAADNLYLATAPGSAAGSTQVDTRRLYELIPNLQASDFDYIVFDMPPLGQTSPTLPMAKFMDKVLLVVEGNKNHVNLVRRTHAQLLQTGVSVSAIFNREKSGGPRWLVDGSA